MSTPKKRRGDIVLSGDSQRLGAATFQRKSMNSKLSKIDLIPHPNGRSQTKANPPFVSSTYVSIQATCPDTCRFKGAGCYVQTGNAANAMNRMDEAARHSTTHPNLLEANLIDRQWNSRKGVPQDGARGGRDLRLHVGGDVLDIKGTRALEGACDDWRGRGGGDVWTYTHRWREIPVRIWGDAISVLASVETVLEAEEAIDLGYTPSFTLASFEDERAHNMGGVRVTPCPAQTRGVKCNQCRLCFKPLPKGGAIGFAWHGASKKGKRKLEILQREHHGQQTLGLE